jgi:hypothetical protein
MNRVKPAICAGQIVENYSSMSSRLRAFLIFMGSLLHIWMSG